MRNVLILFFLIIFIGCKEQTHQEKLLEVFTKEMGKPIEDLSDPANLYYKWQNVDIEEGKQILGLADKTLDMLPTRKRELAGGSNGFYDLREYENPSYTITIENHFVNKDNGDTTITVKLWIRNK